MPKAEWHVAGAAFLLVGCAEEPEPKARPEPRREAPKKVEPSLPEPVAAKSPAMEGSSAAETLRRYHGLIRARRFVEAYRLREPGGADLQAFTAHFERFRAYDVTVGTPSLPAAAGEWIYVEVPVQTYGTMADGEPFGSAGTMTLRRGKSGGEWRIYTKR